MAAAAAIFLSFSYPFSELNRQSHLETRTNLPIQILFYTISHLRPLIKQTNQKKREKPKMREQDRQTRVLYELCSMIIHILRSPPLPISFPSLSLLSSPPSSSSSPPAQISPAAFGSLFIGISIALMLFGSVTFVIGLILMPLVITLVLLFYFVGIVSNLSEIGRDILWPSPDSIKFEPAWNYSS
ncbi:uncharacterized protein LOC105177442 [Sesamum indicum]|uniref:Uncharacterized protein LOC105177442 n=1 Tax=Sesamum indicum TaxID=4182 RepID=A0A6I9UFL0_SESIN|nr:uncharacterized protein LOC105177442 [Sesamum indicum]